MKRTGFYIIKDFFEKMEDPYLKSNKEENQIRKLTGHIAIVSKKTQQVYIG